MKIFLLYTDETKDDKDRLKKELLQFVKKNDIEEVLNPSPFFKFEVPSLCGFENFALILEPDLVCYEDPRILLHNFQSGPCVAGFDGKVVLWNCGNAEVRQVFKTTKDVKRYLGNYVAKYFSNSCLEINKIFSLKSSITQDEDNQVEF